jgi:hypothetical protein
VAPSVCNLDMEHIWRSHLRGSLAPRSVPPRLGPRFMVHGLVIHHGDPRCSSARRSLQQLLRRLLSIPPSGTRRSHPPSLRSSTWPSTGGYMLADGNRSARRHRPPNCGVFPVAISAFGLGAGLAFGMGWTLIVCLCFWYVPRYLRH